MTSATQDGIDYAESWIKALKKFEKFGQLQTMIGIDKIPSSQPDVNQLIEEKAIPNARNLRIRETNEVKRPNPEEDLEEFLNAFCTRLQELLVHH